MMIWDGLLIAVFLLNIVRSATRGGREVGIELLAFTVTYGATLSFAPLLTMFVRATLPSPPPLLSLISVLCVYLLVRKGLRAALAPLEIDPREKAIRSLFRTRLSYATGAGLGVIRGGLVVVFIALLGCSLARLQHVGYMQLLPRADHSVAVQSASQLVDVMVNRYTRDAGPTSQLLLHVALHPDDPRNDERLRAFWNGPFMARLKSSEAVQDLAKNAEVKRLLEEKRAAEVLTHPAFLRALAFTLRELREEKPGDLAQL